jgi:hypothetical protein
VPSSVVIEMIVPVTVIGSVVVVAPCPFCPLPVELVCANASGTMSTQARVTIAFFIMNFINVFLFEVDCSNPRGTRNHPHEAL